MMTRTPNPHNRRKGFTLMELLMVIVIMAIISAIGLASYFNMSSGGAYVSIEQNIQNMVTLARQQAALQNRPVYMLLSHHAHPDFSGNRNQDIHEIVLVFEGGIVTSTENSSNPLYIRNSFVEPPDQDEDLTQRRSTLYVYNVEKGSRHKVARIGGRNPPDTESEQRPGNIYNALPQVYDRDAIKFVFAARSDFNKKVDGKPPFQPYGFVLQQPYRLPRGFGFPEDLLARNSSKAVKFTPGGDIFYSASPGNFSKIGSTPWSFDIQELIRQDPLKVKISGKGVVEVKRP